MFINRDILVYLSTKELPKYQNSVLFNHYCITEFVYVNQAFTSLELESFFQNKLHISKLLVFISMFDKQYWKCSKVCNTWKIKKKLTKKLVWFTCLHCLLTSFSPQNFKILTPKIKTFWPSRADIFCPLTHHTPLWRGVACHDS